MRQSGCVCVCVCVSLCERRYVCERGCMREKGVCVLVCIEREGMCVKYSVCENERGCI